MVINIKASQIQKFCVLQVALFSLKFVGMVSFSSASIISSRVIIESSMVLVKYLPFSQLHVAGFQI